MGLIETRTKFQYLESGQRGHIHPLPLLVRHGRVSSPPPLRRLSAQRRTDDGRPQETRPRVHAHRRAQREEPLPESPALSTGRRALESIMFLIDDCAVALNVPLGGEFSPDTRSDEVLVLDRASDADDEQYDDPLHPDLCSRKVSLLSETGCPSCLMWRVSAVRHPRPDASHVCRLHVCNLWGVRKHRSVSAGIKEDLPLKWGPCPCVSRTTQMS